MTSGEWIGPYEVLGEIGSGGQGAVYRARHAQGGHLAAIKVLTSRDRADLKRFQQEAEVLRRLDHPNVLRLLEVGESNGCPFIALELVEGESLEEVVRLRGLPEPAWIKSVLGGLARALDYCHAQGVIHRDLKPANVLVERSTQRPVLVDFGMVQRDAERMSVEALDAMSRLSLSGEVKGTPGYMAPEQADDQTYGAIGPKADVYGLGGILYFLLCGRAPFEGSTSYNVLLKLMQEDPLPARHHRPEVDAGLESVCLRALSKDSSERQLSPSEVAREIEALSNAGEGARGLIYLAVAGFTLAALAAIAFWALRSTSPLEKAPSAAPPSETPIGPSLRASSLPSPRASLQVSPTRTRELPRRPAGEVIRFDLKCSGRRLAQRTPCPDFTGDGVRDLLVNVGERDLLRSSLLLVSGADGSTQWRYTGVRLWTAALVQELPQVAVVAGGASLEGQPEAVWLDPRSGEVIRRVALSARAGLIPGTPLARPEGLLFWNLAKDWENPDPPISLVETGPTGEISETHTLADFLGEDYTPELNTWSRPVVTGPRQVAICVARAAMGLDLSQRKVLWQARTSKELAHADRFQRGFVITGPGEPPHERVLCSWRVADAKGKPGIQLVLIEKNREAWRKTLWGDSARASWLALPVGAVTRPILVTRAGGVLLLDPSDGRVLQEGVAPTVSRPALVVSYGGRRLIALLTPESRPRVLLLDASLREVWSWRSPHLEQPPKKKKARDPWLAVDDTDGDGFDEIYLGLPYASRLILLAPDLE